jgi:hypothetical protein
MLLSVDGNGRGSGFEILTPWSRTWGQGADCVVSDLYMSLIHTCELNAVNPFDYLTELQRHSEDLAATPAEWMPWNCRETLERVVSL